MTFMINMHKHSLVALGAGVAIAAFSSTAQAATLTQWNFNSLIPDNNTGTGTTSPAIGSGTASVIGGVTSPGFNSGVGSSDPALSDNSGWQTTSYPAVGAGNKTAGVQFNVSTVGQQNIVVTFDQRHSNTSSRYVQFQYTTNGSTFVDFGSLFDGNAGDTWFNNRTVNLSSILGVNNNSNFGFRIVAAFAPGTSAYAPSNSTSTYGTAGTWRFDMVTVSADPTTAIPTPALLPGLLGFGVSVWRKRKSEAIAE
jgi:hypothetical protein